MRRWPASAYSVVTVDVIIFLHISTIVSVLVLLWETKLGDERLCAVFGDDHGVTVVSLSPRLWGAERDDACP